MTPRIFVGDETRSLEPGVDYRLPEPAMRHVAQALRMRVGEPLTLFTGTGGEYATTIAHIDASRPAAAQELVYLGGPTSGPGYDYHAFAATSGAAQHVELRMRVPFPSFPLGRFGRAPGEATIAPFAHAIWVNGARRSPNGADGVFPSVGVGLLTPFDLLRVDVGRGLRDGRWTFSLDIAREFWSVL